MSVNNFFNPFISESFQQSENTSAIQFGSGKLEGVFGWDTVALTGQNSDHPQNPNAGTIKI